MKKLFGALLVLLISVGAALWFREQGGFVIIRLGEWTVEMSVILFIGAVVAAVILLYLILGLLRRLLGLPGGVRRWVGARKQKRARNHLIEGMVRMAEGRYAEAEKLLTRDVSRSEAPLLHHLAAAVAAQRQEAPDRRDRYLALADRSTPRTQPAVGLIQAQLQYDAGHLEQALATLSFLQDRWPQHPGVLKLLMKCCLALKDWERLGQLLPQLRRQGVVDEPRALELEVTVGRHRLEAANRQGADELDRVWHGLSKNARDDDELVGVYTDALVVHGREAEAEKLLRTRLQKRWSNVLVARYGALKEDPTKLLAQVEKWLKERPDDAVLLHVAGRHCLRNQLWGRARSYFEAAVARNPQPESYQALGGLLEQLGEQTAARECYRQAVELTTHKPTLEELSSADRSALAAHAAAAKAT